MTVKDRTQSRSSADTPGDKEVAREPESANNRLTVSLTEKTVNSLRTILFFVGDTNKTGAVNRALNFLAFVMERESDYELVLRHRKTKETEIVHFM